MAGSTAAGGGATGNGSTIDLNTLASDWNTAFKNTQTTDKSKQLQFPPDAIDQPIRACNTLLEYLQGAQKKLNDLLHIDPSALAGGGGDSSLPSLMGLADQFNELADTNLNQILNAHINIVKTIAATLGYAGQVLVYTDQSSASTANSTIDQQVTSSFQNLLNDMTQSDPTSLSSSANNPPLSAFDLGDAPTFNDNGTGAYRAFTPTQWETTPPASIGGKNVTQWSKLPDNGNWESYKEKGSPSYGGTFAPQIHKAESPSALQWTHLYGLSKAQPKLLANSAHGWSYLATQLQHGFARFSNEMQGAMRVGASKSDPTVWTGNGKDQCAAAMQKYINSSPELLSPMMYTAFLLQQAADYLSTTIAYMPYLDGQPASKNYGAGYKYIPPGTVVVPADAVTSVDRTSYGKVAVTTHLSGIISIPASSGKIAVYYQDGIAGPDHADSVGTALLKYHVAQYANWYQKPYDWISSQAPTLPVPTAAANGTAGTSGDPTPPPPSKNPSAPAPPSANGVVSVPTGTPTAGVPSMPTMGGTLVAPASPGGALPSLNSLESPSLKNLSASSPTIADSVNSTDPNAGAAVTPAAYTPDSSGQSGTLSNMAEGLGQDAQQALSPIAQGVGSQQQYAQAAQNTADLLRAASARPADITEGGKGAGGVERFAAGESSRSLESEQGATATARLFPRAGAMSPASEETMSSVRAASAEPEGAGTGYPGGMGGPASAAGRGNEQKPHRSPGYLSRRHLDAVMGEAPVTTIPVVEEK
ncbi:hypothetical protein KO481_15720 [Nocardia sp. NEAU-G5]|uniref:Uncharacterized protein n=1 Tax=Nocardia albiluteola TaxID=2842303 RepID=A0ABS6B0H9_9NOCA|nr:hypothetical protein [Nocardia albiluteola]MBU3062966.1 hypothetical protein [Nocardia albiluteola]